MIKMYSYVGCGSCRKATKWFDSKGIAVVKLPIRDQPPTREELAFMIDQYPGNLRKVFNTSGQTYRSMGLKDRLPTMTRAEAIDLLANDGNLIKRPFVIWGSTGSVGFNEEEWEQSLAQD